MTSQDWQQRALCAAHPPETFFLDGVTGATLIAREVRAKQICRGCPVLRQCRDHAVNEPELHGIWGATTPRERNRIRRVGNHAPSASGGAWHVYRKSQMLDARSS